MIATYTTGGGWFSDGPSSTGARAHTRNIIVAASLIVSTGTGFFANNLKQIQQPTTTNHFAAGHTHTYEAALPFARTAAEDVERIREILSPAVSDLARSFSVSRQTIYNWLNGEAPTPEHTSKLKDLALAADVFADAGVPINGILLKRKIADGKNLLEIVREGGSAQNAAHSLLTIIQREARDRQRLANRFSGRRYPAGAADSDLMADNSF